MATRRVPWKRNLLKIPKGTWEKTRSFKSNSCVASCAIKIPIEEIKSRRYAHLGIRWGKKGLRFEGQVVPLPEMGKYSKENVEGREIVRKDLGKEQRYTSVETPNYGDWSLGSHTVDLPYEAYPRDFIGPKFVAITVEQIGEDATTGARIFRFTVDEVLQRNKRKFKDQLLWALNLLQENTGNHDVYETTATVEDYLKTLYVNWEILPPGEREDNLKKILSVVRTTDPKVRAEIRDRYDFLSGLKPMDFVRGTNGFRAYFGARFADDLVVFENVEYGNAIYVMFETWKDLSKRSRVELLSGRGYKFVRIPHVRGWKTKVRATLKKARPKRS